MFTPKKAIPPLGVAVVALTGCGGDGDNGGTGALRDALQAFCMKIVDCYSAMYPDYTVQDCVNFYNDERLANYNIDASCEAAAISYFNCGTGLSCQEIMADSNSCDDEFYAIFDACEPVMQ